MFRSTNRCPVWMRRAFPGFAAALVLLLSTSVAAGADKDRPEASIGRPSQITSGVRSLQEILLKKRARAPVLVAIPLAYRYGNEPRSYYCSPSIRVTNSSNSSVEEIIIGIAYQQKGRDVGHTITRLVNIGVGKQDTHFFYQLDTDNCFGVTGEVSVLRCMYADGEECVSDVRASHFGTITLTLTTP